MKTYAGIGSRSTPAAIQCEMTQIAGVLADKGWLLRSGRADGADWAFEAGSDGFAEIFLPWPSFNSHLGEGHPLVPATLERPTREAFAIAEQFHPAWDKLSAGGQRLQARNSHQILGVDLKSPVSFVICWTKDGKASGGTGQAIRIAEAHNIPVFNLAKQTDTNRVGKLLTPCELCGVAPCYRMCPNSPHYYSPEREKADALYNDSLSYNQWFSQAVVDYELAHGEPYVS